MFIDWDIYFSTQQNVDVVSTMCVRVLSSNALSACSHGLMFAGIFLTLLNFVLVTTGMCDVHAIARSSLIVPRSE